MVWICFDGLLLLDHLPDVCSDRRIYSCIFVSSLRWKTKRYERPKFSQHRLDCAKYQPCSSPSPSATFVLCFCHLSSVCSARMRSTSAVFKQQFVVLGHVEFNIFPFDDSLRKSAAIHPALPHHPVKLRDVEVLEQIGT